VSNLLTVGSYLLAIVFGWVLCWAWRGAVEAELVLTELIEAIDGEEWE
jgi:hypothetical protein